MLPNGCNMHTLSDDHRVDHPSNLHAINNSIRKQQCDSFIRKISNEPCLRYLSNIRGKCRCLQILNSDIYLF